MDAKNRQKKVNKRSRENDNKEPSDKITPPTIEEEEITMQTLEGDISIISLDKSEENQPSTEEPIIVSDEEKPANTSTPKRKRN